MLQTRLSIDTSSSLSSVWIAKSRPVENPENRGRTISIYNQKGQLVRTLHLGEKKAGVYVTKDKAAYWDGRDSSGQKVASGIYFYTIQAGKFTATRKMVIMK